MCNNLNFRLQSIVTAFSLWPSLCILAQQHPESSLQIIATYDYPGAVGFINSSGINDKGEVAGYFIDATNAIRGFVRFHDGTFSSPIIAPNDTSGVTEASDINNTPTVCGSSYDAVNNAFHGFFLTDQTFTLFDINGALSTSVVGINADGDFVGASGSDADSNQAYIDVDGEIISFTIPEASFSTGTAINGAGVAVGNYRLETDSPLHGFLRDATGNLTYPLDFPGSTATSLRGISDRGLVVGSYTDFSSVQHGFVFKPPTTFFSFTYPGATYTTFGGINNRKVVCGDYIDVNGIRHGFIGRIR